MGALAKALQRVNYLKDLANLLYQYGQEKKYSELVKNIQGSWGNLDGLINLIKNNQQASTLNIGNLDAGGQSNTLPQTLTPTQQDTKTLTQPPPSTLIQPQNQTDGISALAQLQNQIQQLTDTSTQPPATQPLTDTTTQLPTETQQPTVKSPIKGTEIAEEINKLIGKYHFDYNNFKQLFANLVNNYNNLMNKILTSNISSQHKNALIDLANKRFNAISNILEMYKPKPPDIGKIDIDSNRFIVKTPYGAFLGEGNNYRKIINSNTILDKDGVYKVHIVYEDETGEIKDMKISTGITAPEVKGKGSSEKETEKLTSNTYDFFAFVANVKNIIGNKNPAVSNFNLRNVPEDTLEILKGKDQKNFIDAKKYLDNRIIGKIDGNKVTLGNLKIDLDTNAFGKAQKGKSTYGLISHDLIENLVAELGLKSKDKDIDVYNFFEQKVNKIDNLLKEKLGYQMDKTEKSLLTNYYYTYFLTNYYQFKSGVLKNQDNKK